MALAINLNEIEDNNNFVSLQAGNYVGTIVNVEYVPVDNNTGKGHYINVDFDITEGPLANYASNLNEKFGFWPLTFSLSLKPNVAWKFKNFVESVEDYDYETNVKGGEWNEHSLEGKDFGISVQMEKYIGKDDQEKIRLNRWGNHIFGAPDDARANKLKLVKDAESEELSTLNTAAGWLIGDKNDSFDKAEADNPFA